MLIQLGYFHWESGPHKETIDKIKFLNLFEIGRMYSTSMNKSFNVNKLRIEKNEKWGFDNGVYSSFLQGKEFQEVEFFNQLDILYKKFHKPHIAVLPDIVGGGNKSLDFSISWIEKLPKDWPWYLVLQDGMSENRVAEVVDEVSGLFLGGTNQFKGEAVKWSLLAKKIQKPFHYGRAGTRNKVKHAYHVLADSLDSSFPLWSKENMKKFVDTIFYMENLQKRGKLFSIITEQIRGQNVY